MVQYILTMADH